jgi:hypothetical protein
MLVRKFYADVRESSSADKLHNSCLFALDLSVCNILDEFTDI